MTSGADIGFPANDDRGAELTGGRASPLPTAVRYQVSQPAQLRNLSLSVIQLMIIALSSEGLRPV